MIVRKTENAGTDHSRPSTKKVVTEIASSSTIPTNVKNGCARRRIGSPHEIYRGPRTAFVAQFMGGLMKDPTVGRRYQLKSWEIKQAAAAGSQPAGEREQLLVLFVLSEKPR